MAGIGIRSLKSVVLTLSWTQLTIYHRAEDVHIAVLGLAGTGKSTFVARCAGALFPKSGGWRSGITSPVNSCPRSVLRTSRYHFYHRSFFRTPRNICLSHRYTRIQWHSAGRCCNHVGILSLTATSSYKQLSLGPVHASNHRQPSTRLEASFSEHIQGYVWVALLSGCGHGDDKMEQGKWCWRPQQAI